MNLNLSALLGRINRSLEEVSRFVSIATNGHSDAEPQGAGPFSIQFSSGLSWTREEAQLACQNWVLKNGFRDIAELISVVLEEAYSVLSYYALLDRQSAGETLPLSVVEERELEATKFHRLSLSDKLERLHSFHAFTIPEGKIGEVASINVARNCLSHRAGVVANRDTIKDDTLVVTWLGLDTLATIDGSEVFVEPPMYFEKGTTISVRITQRHKTFKVGDRISFDAREFSEIAWTVFTFAQSVAKSLQAAGEARGMKFTPPQA